MDALPPEVARFRAIPMSIVRLEHVFKDYTLGEQKVQALKDISLDIEEGAFAAIAGPSGSGKSTLLNLIGCIDTPSAWKNIYRWSGHQWADAR